MAVQCVQVEKKKQMVLGFTAWQRVFTWEAGATQMSRFCFQWLDFSRSESIVSINRL